MTDEMTPAVPNVESASPSAPAPEVQAPSEASTPGENQVPNSETTEQVETKEEKYVPLKEHIDERTRRKSAEEYSRSLLKQIESQRSVPPQVAQPNQASTQPQEEYIVEADPSQFMTRSEYEFSQREASGWNDAKSEYRDEFKEYPVLESLAEGLRQQYVLSGKGYLTPKESVEAILKDMRRERAAGQRAATESIKIQTQAAIQGSGTKVDTETELINTLKTGLQSRDRKTRDMSLRELLKRGAI